MGTAFKIYTGDKPDKHFVIYACEKPYRVDA